MKFEEMSLLAPKLEELLLRRPLGTPAVVGGRVPPVELVTVGSAEPAALRARRLFRPNSSQLFPRLQRVGLRPLLVIVPSQSEPALGHLLA